jgi:gluconolactonase
VKGPLWIEKNKMLLFSDVPQNTIYKWTEAKGKEVYLTPSGYTEPAKRGGETGSNGLTLDNSGNLILTQCGNRQIARWMRRLINLLLNSTVSPMRIWERNLTVPMM